jgi:hypothetical protein
VVPDLLLDYDKDGRANTMTCGGSAFYEQQPHLYCCLVVHWLSYQLRPDLHHVYYATTDGDVCVGSYGLLSGTTYDRVCRSKSEDREFQCWTIMHGGGGESLEAQVPKPSWRMIEQHYCSYTSQLIFS